MTKSEEELTTVILTRYEWAVVNEGLQALIDQMREVGEDDVEWIIEIMQGIDRQNAVANDDHDG